MKKKNKWLIMSSCLIVVIIMCILHLTTDLINSFDEWCYNTFCFAKATGLTKYFEFMTCLADVKTLSILCALSLITLFFKKKSSIYLIGLMMVSTLINQLLKWMMAVPRPETASAYPEVTGFSFPSGHTMGAVSFYGFIIWLVINSSLSKAKKIIVSSILLFLIINIAYSRVYLGVHYFSDVIAGALISIVLLIVITTLISKYRKDDFS